jgi:ABC transporter with metal-binding/Fe-S-binding domain ATP-binding protein
MDVVVLLSGGKDSVFSLYKTVEAGHKIKYLITVFPVNKESWMFHYPCIELTKLQAKALGIKHVVVQTKGIKENELEDLKKALEKVKQDVKGIVSGAVKSTYQKARIDALCSELGLKSIHPLWQKNEKDILKEEAELMQVMIVGVYSEGLDKNWLGRYIDEKCFNELVDLAEKNKINLSGEGGDYETAVLDCPLFKKKIEIKKWHTVWEGNSGYLVVDKAELVEKY